MTHPGDCFKRGLQAHKNGQLTQAVQAYRQALQMAPDYWACWANLAQLEQERGQFQEAILAAQQALAHAPSEQHDILRLRLARLYRQVGLYAQALQVLTGASDQQQREWVLNQRALGQLKPALQRSRQLSLQTRLLADAQLWSSLALQLQDSPSALEALTFAEGLLPCDSPQISLLRAQKAQIWQDQAQLGESHQLLQGFADPHARLTKAFLLPVIHTSQAEAKQALVDYDKALSDLETFPLSEWTDPLALPSLPFYLPYQGEPVRERQERLSKLIRPLLPQWSSGRIVRRPGPWRVGCVSRYWYQHSVMRFFAELLLSLSQGDFECWAFAAGPQLDDDVHRHLRQHMTHWVPLKGDLHAQLAQIAEADLDVLLYTDTGLDPQSYLLSHYRLAPQQWLLPGQPMTSGVATLDAFVSDIFSEPEEAHVHYSERLLLCPLPPTVYARPPALHGSPPPLPTGNLYLCPGQIFKLHPEMDALFAGILRADPRAQLLVLQQQAAVLYRTLWQRWKPLMGEDLARVHLLPHQSPASFQALLQAVDVVLETRPFGSATTTLAALAVGTPVVTWPGDMLCGRYSAGFMRSVGLNLSEASDAQSYIQRALELAQDKSGQVRQQILGGFSAFFERQAVIPMWHDLLLSRLE